MRTNIVIDDDLMDKAMQTSGAATKKEAVEQGLRLLIQKSSQSELREIRGVYRWEGNLDEMRRNE